MDVGTFQVTWRAENLDAAAMGTSLDTSDRMLLAVVGWEWGQAVVAVHHFDLALAWAAVNAFDRAVAWLVDAAGIELSWTYVAVVVVVAAVVVAVAAAG